VAMATSLFAAARLLDVTAGGQGSRSETGGCLAVGLLILVVSRTASTVGRLRRSRLPSSARRVFLLRAATGAALEALSALLLAMPALVVVWELGASGGEMLRLGVALLVVVACGIALGGLAASAGLRTPVAAIVAASVGALLLWPASLGWFSGVPRFPEIELPAALLPVLVFVAGLPVLPVLLRRTRGVVR